MRRGTTHVLPWPMAPFATTMDSNLGSWFLVPGPWSLVPGLGRRPRTEDGGPDHHAEKELRQEEPIGQWTASADRPGSRDGAAHAADVSAPRRCARARSHA